MPPYSTPVSSSSIGQHANLDMTSNKSISEPIVQVICAWPVSGQYGFGARILYYTLVATCVLARKTEWLRHACLTAALLLPSVAAIHAIVLAAVHVDTAVDLDIYGAFQICSIGALTAPLTVWNSKTYFINYFHGSGRNILFLWTFLLLAGLISLTVESIRIESQSCPFDSGGAPIDYSSLASCDPNCVYGSNGPSSPIRRGPTNEPFIILAPNRLTIGTVALLAAGSSIPPLLFQIYSWHKTLEDNWKRRFAPGEVEGVGSNTINSPVTYGIKQGARYHLGRILIPFFYSIIVILLVLGEVNFWSRQVSYQTEPISSIGQWANIAGTALVLLGSVYYKKQPQDTEELQDMNSNRVQSSMKVAA
ncbi:hypothetical protein F4808DRAFT_409892 [Astrocystis sublimbata]|nr:hypothetical protein F4808DRAFT_409892 [Astrocystis sublimbata]